MTLTILKAKTQTEDFVEITVQQDIQPGYFQIGLHINGIENILRTDTPADLSKIAELFYMAKDSMIRLNRRRSKG